MNVAGQQPAPFMDGYRDFSGVVESSGEAAAPQPTDHNFPVKLHYVLSELEEDGMDHIASWAPHGRCFKVHDTDQFVEAVLRRWFRQSQIASFQRQLNIYGFTRITFGPDKHSYYHEHFLRGKLFLSRRIQRTTIKGQGPRRPSCYQNQPNFYNMRFLPPTSAVTNASASAGTASLPVERNEPVAGAMARCVDRGNHTATPLSIHPPMTSSFSLRDFVGVQRMPNQESVGPLMARPSSLGALRAIASSQLAAQEMQLRQYPSASSLIPPHASLASASNMLSASANMNTMSSSGLARAMVLESMAASRRRQEAAMVQDHVRAQIIASIAGRTDGQAEDEENRRRQLVRAFLNRNT